MTICQIVINQLPIGYIPIYANLWRKLAYDRVYKKCENLNNSTSSDPYEMKYSLFESSHRDESNGGKIKPLASIHHEITYAKHVLKN
jgi:hypothetical protein